MNGAVCDAAMGVTLGFEDDLPQRDRWARLRFAIVGPLLAAPPAAGELHDALTVLAAKTWRHPFSGLDVRFGVSTIERWLYAAKNAPDSVLALPNQVRRDIGRFPSLSAEAVAALTTQYRAHLGAAQDRHQHDDRGGIDFRPQKSQRRGRLTLTALLHGTAEAEPLSILLAQPDGQASRLASITGRMQSAAAVRTPLRTGAARQMLVKSQQ